MLPRRRPNQKPKTKRINASASTAPRPERMSTRSRGLKPKPFELSDLPPKDPKNTRILTTEQFYDYSAETAKVVPQAHANAMYAERQDEIAALEAAESAAAATATGAQIILDAAAAANANATATNTDGTTTLQVGTGSQVNGAAQVDAIPKEIAAPTGGSRSLPHKHRFLCNVPGCSSGAYQFGELQRHVRTTHKKTGHEPPTNPGDVRIIDFVDWLNGRIVGFPATPKAKKDYPEFLDDYSGPPQVSAQMQQPAAPTPVASGLQPQVVRRSEDVSTRAASAANKENIPPQDTTATGPAAGQKRKHDDAEADQDDGPRKRPNRSTIQPRTRRQQPLAEAEVNTEPQSQQNLQATSEPSAVQTRKRKRDEGNDANADPEDSRPTKRPIRASAKAPKRVAKDKDKPVKHGQQNPAASGNTYHSYFPPVPEEPEPEPKPKSKDEDPYRTATWVAEEALHSARMKARAEDRDYWAQFPLPPPQDTKYVEEDAYMEIQNERNRLRDEVQDLKAELGNLRAERGRAEAAAESHVASYEMALAAVRVWEDIARANGLAVPDGEWEGYNAALSALSNGEKGAEDRQGGQGEDGRED
ncbi:uncharacterized protein HMPREF1541_01703 [Cyphellophora europaea CBS 101466]|uniref:Uncharacterized protein n=1 Tax=Cyphellophora europaea (strain CBS 101466) TaxID=1220924 RepID=W2S1E5_CYPE1|nr:uncharacterized protein HMPREF1541_01703 [Cyphellophora europaea CBS 101466]ETN42546.1 hypothetical protein HMPREF1541_01703 [Cyphellophora europaea CBS 101466]